MALSGNYHNYPVSSFGLYVEWSAIQNTPENYSDVTQKIYLSYYTISVGSRDDAVSSINNVSETFSTPAISDYSSGWKKKLLYTQTVRVNHDEFGKATNIPLSASWRFSGTYSSVPISWINASASIDLNNIDVSAPKVTASTSDVSANSVAVSATASTTCDRWDYSINNGQTWTNFSTVSGSSASKVITGLNPNVQYDIVIRARKKTNQVYGYSSAIRIRTLGGSVISSINDVVADNTPAKIVMSAEVFSSSYTHTIVIKDGQTTVLTISGLSLVNGANNISLSASQRNTILNYMSNKREFNATFELLTYSGSTKVGNTSTKSNVIVTTSAINSSPTFTSFTYRDSNQASVAITEDDQMLINKISNLVISASEAVAKNGATISSYSILAGGQSRISTSRTINVGPLYEEENETMVAIIVTAIDSRGYQTTVAKNARLIQYKGSRITSFSIRRVDEVGETIQVHFSGYIAPILVPVSDTEVDKNDLVSIKYRYKKTDETEWSSYTDITDDVTYYNNEYEYQNENFIDLDPEFSFNIEFRIENKINSGSYGVIVSQASPLISLRKKMVGINKRDPIAAADVLGDANVSGNVTIDTSDSGLKELIFRNDSEPYVHDVRMRIRRAMGETWLLRDAISDRNLIRYFDNSGPLKNRFIIGAPDVQNLINGDIEFNTDGLTSGRIIRFKNTAGSYIHNISLYGGNPTSGLAFGAYDAKNDRDLFYYTDTDNTFRIMNSGGNIILGDSTSRTTIKGNILDDFIVERNSGNYANSYYIKYASGWMESWRTVTVTINCNTAWAGGLYYGTDSTAWSFAKDFIETPPYVQVDYSIPSGNTSFIPACIRAPEITKSTYKELGIVRPNSANVTVKATIHALGKWK